MNNAVFGKTIENMRKRRDTKLFTAERRRNYLESEPSFQATKFFTGNLLATEMKKRRWVLYDYVKLNYDVKAKLCYTDTDFIVYLKADDIYRDITEDVKIRSDTSGYELDRPLPKKYINK